jgi:hypothetical protein
MLYDKFIDAAGAFAEELGFLARAVSDDETRCPMQYIHVEPSEAGKLKGVATDGKRLHIVKPFSKAAEIMGLTSGFWQVFKNTEDRVWIARLDDKETDGLIFQAYQKVIPNGKAKYETTFEGFAFSGRYTKQDDLAKFLHDFPDVTAINLRHLADLGTATEWKVDWKMSKITELQEARKQFEDMVAKLKMSEVRINLVNDRRVFGFINFIPKDNTLEINASGAYGTIRFRGDEGQRLFDALKELYE